MSGLEGAGEDVHDPIPQSELLDVVDVNGEPTGIQAEKAFIHREGAWHRDVHVWITDGDNVLQQQRAWDKSIMPGAWDISVGGHVRAGETYLEAARRETVEETDLAFETPHFLPAGKLAVEMEMQGGTWTHRTVGDNFVVVDRGLTLDDVHMQESEVIDVRLYPIDQLETDLADPTTAGRHAPQPLALWQLGISAMRAAAREQNS